MTQRVRYSEIMAELSKRDYSEYVEYTNGPTYKHGRFSRYLCRRVQDFIEADTGHAFDILLLSTPPQHSKSTTVTETLPSWCLGKWPDKRIIEVSHKDQFAVKFARRCHEKIDRFGKELFDIEIGKPDLANEFYIKDHLGSFQSVGVSTGVSGMPCDILIIDDPVGSQQDADSETLRTKLIDEWVSSYVGRLSPGAKVIVIQTRWHKQDLYGYLMENEAHHVTRINFPIECEVDTDEIGRHRGDALFPEMGKDKAWLEDFKKSFIKDRGSRAWNALYRGQPTDEEGGIFKREWWNYYDILPPIIYKIISVDANFKESKKGEDHDFVAIQVWGKTGADMFLIEKFKAQIGFVDTLVKLNEIIARHMDYQAIYIEDKANGSAIIDTLSRKYNAVIPVQPEGGKEARAFAVSPILEAGNVYIKRDRDYDLVESASDFPYGGHDDDVDCMTQAWNRLRNIVADMALPDHDPDDDEYVSLDDQYNEIAGWKG